MRWKSRSTVVPILAALTLTLSGAAALEAQATGTVAGVVRSGTTQQPVVAAQVSVVGTQLTGVTNENGAYSITGVPAGQHTLRVETLGFSRREVPVTVTAGQTTTTNIDMSVSAITLGEIVVTGTPGAQTKRELGNSIGSVKVGDRLETAPITNAAKVNGITLRKPLIRSRFWIPPIAAITEPAACWARRPVEKVTSRVPKAPLSITAVRC